MRTDQTGAKTIDDYITAFPHEVQAILEQIRMTIREAAPDAEETISYHMPTFMLNGQYLVYFAAYKKHIGLYPAPIGIEEFQADVSVYGAGKGTMKFPFDQDSVRPDTQNCEVQGTGKHGNSSSKREEEMR